MDVSIIVPVYNEAQSLQILHQKIREAMAQVPLVWEVKRDNRDELPGRVLDWLFRELKNERIKD